MNIAKFLRTRIFKNMYERLFLYFRILKKIFLKIEKMANWKLRKVGNLGKIIPSLYLLYSQNRKLGFEILRKKFTRFLRFPRFLNFRPGHYEHPEISHHLMDRAMKQSTHQFHKIYFHISKCLACNTE